MINNMTIYQYISQKVEFISPILYIVIYFNHCLIKTKIVVIIPYIMCIDAVS